MKSAEDFIVEITLGNVSQSEIKSYIRSLDMKLKNAEEQLDLIRLKQRQKTLDNEQRTIQRLIDQHSFF